ncbi:hypothetical protein [Hyphomonas johnsonii]|uniref:Uncharacterized protein n=1 Tax=Hyphomonas johnsonii MHS-2 TaxID=1280950 RepID=A0A059FVZ4_9PROT|nr:hypothetical protein [Hyphomonas johnsonii]KCZ94661.1 hypothetical protein HJO_04765 [Hyphomonas johnsonii MHS-2]
MKRLLLVFTILVALGIGLGPWAYRTFFDQRPAMALPAFDYRALDSWAATPAEVPPAVWMGGWGVDVFLVGPKQDLAAKSESELSRDVERARHQAGGLSQELAPVGPVYAPLYRAGESAPDLAAAFKNYLDTHNRGRAFVIATEHPLPASMLRELETDAALRERFGGFLRLTRPKGDSAQFQAVASGAGIAPFCPERLTGDACQPIVEIGRQDGNIIVTEPAPIGGEQLAAFPDWLEANVAKTAEPLGALEEVEIIDIRRPGETDEQLEARGEEN